MERDWRIFSNSKRGRKFSKTGLVRNSIGFKFVDTFGIRVLITIRANRLCLILIPLNPLQFRTIQISTNLKPFELPTNPVFDHFRPHINSV